HVLQPSAMTGLLTDLGAIRDAPRATNPALAAQIDTALPAYQDIDFSKLSTSPPVRNTTRRVLYSDLFQSQFGNYLFNLLRLDFGPSLGLTSRGRPVNEIIGEKLPISISLGIMAVV